MSERELHWIKEAIIRNTRKCSKEKKIRILQDAIKYCQEQIKELLAAIEHDATEGLNCKKCSAVMVHIIRDKSNGGPFYQCPECGEIVKPDQAAADPLLDPAFLRKMKKADPL